MWFLYHTATKPQPVVVATLATPTVCVSDDHLVCLRDHTSFSPPATFATPHTFVSGVMTKKEAKGIRQRPYRLPFTPNWPPSCRRNQIYKHRATNRLPLSACNVCANPARHFDEGEPILEGRLFEQLKYIRDINRLSSTATVCANNLCLNGVLGETISIEKLSYVQTICGR